MAAMYPSEIRHLRNVRIAHAVALLAALNALPFLGHFVTFLLWLLPCALLLVPRWNEARAIAPLWLLMAGSVFLPFDVSLNVLPGGPRFVRQLGGTPNHEGQAMIHRGEAIAGSCMRTDFTPKWV